MADASIAPVANGVSHDKTVDDTPGVKVFAGNLAYSVTDEGLKAFFEVVASDLLSAQVIYRGTRSAGYGFVALATQEAAEKACETLNDRELDGRKVVVEVAKPADQKDKERSEKQAKKRVSRRGSKAVTGEVTDAEANGETEKPAADATEGGVAKPKKKKNLRKRKVKGENAELTENGPAESKADEATDAANRTPKPKRKPAPRREAGEAPKGELSKTALFVANLPFNLEDEGLAAVFTEAGITVITARIVHRRWGHPKRSKGYGFVDVGDENEQTKAIAALDGKELEGGRQMAVKVAVNALVAKEVADEDGKDHEEA